MPNALQIIDPRGDPDNPLTQGSPTWADAYTQTTDALGQWLAAQRAKSSQAGLWNDQAGMPTGAGVVNAGQQYGNALLMGTTAPGVRAFHGSPHSFEQFDTSKIGTGEGAQAYGHGLYMAENEGVAQSYKMAGPAADARVDAINKQLTQLSKQMDQYSTGQYGKYSDPKGYELKAQYDALMDQRASLGHMYEVNIGADPETFLHWDKPLSEQHPKVQEAVRASGVVPDPVEVNTAGHFGYSLNEFKTLTPEYQQALIAKLPENHANYARDPVGAEVYQDMAAKLHTGPKPSDGGWTMVEPETYRDPAAAAAALRDAGIPGIRYLDQGSRASGEGSHNYVVFDAANLEILRKYGLAGLMAGGAATGAVSGDNQ